MTTKKRRRTLEASQLPAAKRLALENVHFHLNNLTHKRTGFPVPLQNAKHLSLRHIPDNYRLAELAVSHPRVQHLDMSCCFSMNKASMRIVATHWATELISVDFGYCDWITDEDLACFVSNRSSVSPLPLKEINLAYTSITDLGVRHLVKNCPHLTTISLKGCNVTDLALSMLAQNCKFVAVLNVSECKQLTDYAIRIVAQESKANLLQLDLTDCPQIAGSIFPFLTFYCPNLRCLRIRGTKIIGTDISQFVSRSSLTELDVQGLSITDEELFQIASHQQRLETLDISFCYLTSSFGVSKVIELCTELQELHVYGNNLSPQSLGDVGSVRIFH